MFTLLCVIDDAIKIHVLQNQQKNFGIHQKALQIYICKLVLLSYQHLCGQPLPSEKARLQLSTHRRSNDANQDVCSNMNRTPWIFRIGSANYMYDISIFKFILLICINILYIVSHNNIFISDILHFFLCCFLLPASYSLSGHLCLSPLPPCNFSCLTVRNKLRVSDPM